MRFGESRMYVDLTPTLWRWVTCQPRNDLRSVPWQAFYHWCLIIQRSKYQNNLCSHCLTANKMLAQLVCNFSSCNSSTNKAAYNSSSLVPNAGDKSSSFNSKFSPTNLSSVHSTKAWYHLQCIYSWCLVIMSFFELNRISIACWHNSQYDKLCVCRILQMLDPPRGQLLCFDIDKAY